MKRVTLILIALLWCSALELRAADQDAPQHANGKVLYDKYCTQCHGDKGDGLGPAADYVMPKPRDFTNGKYKIRSTGSGQLPTDSDITRAIRHGLAFRGDGAYTAMPPWPYLSEKEITDLVNYLKSFSKDFSDPEYNNPKVIAISKPIAATPESIQKGRQVFEANECVKCHGDKGLGDGRSAPTLKDDWDNPIRPADLTKRFTFRGGGTKEDLFRTVSTGFNGSPMPSYADNVSEEDRWHLVNYLFSLSERDHPDYNPSDKPVVLNKVEGAIDLASFEQAGALFEGVPGAIIPLVGQVIEPGREFFPSANELQVKAIYNQDEIALLLRWHDMSAETSGSNAPDLEVASTEQRKVKAEANTDPFADEEQSSDALDPFAEEESSNPYSDAVAIQLPSERSEGFAMPYFVFGDSERPVDLWFMDLAQKQATLWQARGSGSLSAVEGGEVMGSAQYAEGAWSVIFKRPRVAKSGISFDQAGQFTPIAFSVWDGFNAERGNKRGLSTWFYLYQEHEERPSAVMPMLGYGGLLLLLELLLVYWVRRRS